MNVLLIGSGGREHALAWAIAKSPLCGELFIAPGNPGTAECGTNVSLNVQDFEAVVDFIETHQVSLTVVVGTAIGRGHIRFFNQARSCRLWAKQSSG